ncbi:Sec-independent protein translocase protein TatB [Pokkaliibacter sp. CJK22405]|uniref:Sec-independent protein translocase protein TatB n=1 Tax=Pokkaliibacter sp. CJK22405 TaxID=3384615 RepID=UPI003984BC7A
MFDIGFTELLVVGVVALLVLGPERLPVAARTAGLWIGKLKRMVQNVQHEINEELRADELRRQAEKNREHLAKFQQEVSGFSKAAEDTFQGKPAETSAESQKPAEVADSLHHLAREGRDSESVEERASVAESSKQHERT